MGLHRTNTGQKVQIILDHSRANVAHLVEGKTKAIVVTDSREAAVKYREAIDAYIAKRAAPDGSSKYGTLVAFSGSVTIAEDEQRGDSAVVERLPVPVVLAVVVFKRVLHSGDADSGAVVGLTADPAAGEVSRAAGRPGGPAMSSRSFLCECGRPDCCASVDPAVTSFPSYTRSRGNACYHQATHLSHEPDQRHPSRCPEPADHRKIKIKSLHRVRKG